MQVLVRKGHFTTLRHDNTLPSSTSDQAEMAFACHQTSLIGTQKGLLEMDSLRFTFWCDVCNAALSKHTPFRETL